MSRQIQQVFEKYHKARREYVQSIAEAASRPENTEILMKLDVLQLLRPLLLDTVPSIQQTAALAIGRLANYKEEYAEQIVSVGIVPEIVAGVNSQDPYYKRNSCFVIRTISQHSPLLAQQTVDAGVLEPLVNCFTGFDTKVKEAAAWALGSIAMHSPELAQAVVDANAIQYLIEAVQDPEISLRRIAVSTLGDIAKHNVALAQDLINARAISYIAPLVKSQDPKLVQKVCITLSQIAKHSVDCAGLVVEGEIFPEALKCLADKDTGVRRAASNLVETIVKHSQELSQLVMTVGGGAALVTYLKANNDPLKAVMAIGFISAFSQALATSLIDEGAASIVLKVFVSTTDSSVKAASAWALGQMGKHSPTHAGALTQLNVLALLCEANKEAAVDDDNLRQKTKRAIKFIIDKTTDIQAIQPLIKSAPPKILKYVLQQIAKLLPKDQKARIPFVTSGSFQEVQKIQAEPGSKIREYIDTINSCFPEHAVRYYSPSYPDSLLQEIDTYGAA